MDTFGLRLKEARKAKGLTQKQLAETIGAKHNSISNWENDQNKPDPDTIELICGVLDIEPNYLLKKTQDDRLKAYANKLGSNMKVNNTERKIVENFRRADEIEKAIVLRTLHIDNESGYEPIKKNKYIPTEEDIRSLVARNGRKLTREEAIEFISAMYSDDEDEDND